MRNVNYEHKFKNCKVYFAKLTFIAFLFKKICTYKKKAVLLHCQIK